MESKEPAQTIKVVCMSDTHNKHENLEFGELTSGDILIHCGDFTMNGEFDETTVFAKWLEKQDYKYKIVIPGNHERTFDQDRFI
jgi:predicted phosphodiesterase